MLRIALAQINTIVGDLAGNREKIIDGLKKAVSAQADLVVFPELAVTGYPPEDLLHKEHFVRDNLASLREIAGYVAGAVAVVGFVETDKNKNLYNAAAVIARKKVRGIYHKRDLPNYGVFDEKRYFLEGRRQPVFSLNGVGLGITICEDIWSEDGIYLEQARAGVRVIINLSSSPFDYEKLERREKLLTRRAKQCDAYFCYVNLVGGQDELVFDGASMVVSPQGKVVARAHQFVEDILVVDIPVTAQKSGKRSKKGNILVPAGLIAERPSVRSRICDRLTQDERILQALILGTKDYVGKNGFQKVVIGLSGGIDSALVAAVAREAVGQGNVIGISMPSRFSSSETRSDAARLAQNLGLEFKEIPIDEVYQSYLIALQEGFAGLKSNVAEENIQARIRGNILMAFSNKFGWLVLTTGNKSEIAVGYCTLYGDMSGGFAVIKDLPKTRVYEIAKLLNTRLNGAIPESIFSRAPTAELRPHQKDEDSLPPYPVLDPILKAYVEEHRSLKRIVKKHGHEDVVKDVIRMVDQSEYKRRQAPPGIKITPLAFGKDWRLPITNKYQEANISFASGTEKS